jgi:hypothetical protein
MTPPPPGAVPARAGVPTATGDATRPGRKKPFRGRCKAAADVPAELLANARGRQAAPPGTPALVSVRCRLPRGHSLPEHDTGEVRWLDGGAARVAERGSVASYARATLEDFGDVPRLSTSRERVEYIAARMASGRWLGGYTLRLALADAWGVSTSRVVQLAAEAHRVLAASRPDLEHLREEHALFAERIVVEAATRTNKVTGLPDYGAALKASEQAAKFRGLDPAVRSRVELTGRDGAPLDVGRLTDEQLLALLGGVVSAVDQSARGGGAGEAPAPPAREPPRLRAAGASGVEEADAPLAGRGADRAVGE